MIFSELYGVYYNTVARVLERAVQSPLKAGELRRIIYETAFAESALKIEPALKEGAWQLLSPDGSTALHYAPSMPLTTLQKRWLKSISLDPRVRLFDTSVPDFEDVEPLFRPEDVCVFDRNLDGDPFEDEGYIERFRILLRAIRAGETLRLEVRGRGDRTVTLHVLPQKLEYSEKDDKFRLICSGSAHGLVNLARIVCCAPSDREVEREDLDARAKERRRRLVLTLDDRRNALERALLHFAHFQKRAEQLNDGRCRVTIFYDADDENELVIRVLAFGPMIRVEEPEAFAGKIRDRLRRQLRLIHQRGKP